MAIRIVHGKYVRCFINDLIQDIADFLSEKDLPNPRSLSKTADFLLDVQAETKRFAFNVKTESPLISTNSPYATLDARRKVICDICTTNSERPIMVEDGQEWKDHVRARKHRRMQRERERPKVLHHGKEDTTSSDYFDSEDDFALGFTCLGDT